MAWVASVLAVTAVLVSLRALAVARQALRRTERRPGYHPAYGTAAQAARQRD